MINMIIYQTAPEERPETCIRLAEGGKRSRSFCKSSLDPDL